MNEQLTVYELNTAERLLLLSFRLWALPIAAPEKEHMNWRSGFQAVNIGKSVYVIFDSLLATLFSASKRTIEVHHAMCVGMSLDEREFLRCIGLRQNDRVDSASEVLAKWLPLSAARVALSKATNLAEVMYNAGLFLPLREIELMPLQHRPQGAGRGLYLVH